MKKLIVERMRSKIEEVVEVISLRGFSANVSKSNNNVYCYINGVKVEWQIGDGTLRVGYSNSIEDIQNLGVLLVGSFAKEVVNTLKNWVDIKEPTIEAFKTLVDCIADMDLELDSPARGRGTNSNTNGVLFEGSNFSNAHERLTTIGPRFMNMVCKATNMDLENMDAEWPIKDAGRIDGVEVNEQGLPVSIYECQSGIQKGDYLDDEHLSKSLLRYPFDSAILPTLTKIVILAGGYSEEHLEIIKNQAQMFMQREVPIELILLKTNRVDDKIGVGVVNYK